MKKWVFINLLLLSATIVLVVINNLCVDEKWLNTLLEIISIFFGSSSILSFEKIINIANKNKQTINSTGNIEDSKLTNIQGNIVNITYANQNNEQIALFLKKENEKLLIDGQQNTEKIIEKVIDKLRSEKKEVVSPSNDFIKRFLFESSYISDDDLQNIWCSLFISEAKEHKAINFRTLDILKCLTKEEAILFKEVSHCVIVSDNKGFIFKDAFKNINLYNITRLADMGLLKQVLVINWNFNLEINKDFLFYNREIMCLIKNNSVQTINLSLPCYLLTDAGIQLYKVLNLSMDNSSIYDVGNYFKKINKNLSISFHKVITITEDNEVTYYTAEI